jgi:hypothetical protein
VCEVFFNCILQLQRLNAVYMIVLITRIIIIYLPSTPSPALKTYFWGFCKLVCVSVWMTASVNPFVPTPARSYVHLSYNPMISCVEILIHFMTEFIHTCTCTLYLTVIKRSTEVTIASKSARYKQQTYTCIDMCGYNYA